GGLLGCSRTAAGLRFASPPVCPSRRLQEQVKDSMKTDGQAMRMLRGGRRAVGRPAGRAAPAGGGRRRWPGRGGRRRLVVNGHEAALAADLRRWDIHRGGASARGGGGGAGRSRSRGRG